MIAAAIPLRSNAGDVIAWAIMDFVDYEPLSRRRWFRTSTGYAVTGGGAKSRALYMHREISIASGVDLDGREVDHINRDTLDNSRDNLRPVLHWQNQCNRRLPKNNASGLRGVSWHRVGRKWRAEISHRGINKYLGLFKTKEDAHAAYRHAASLFNGAFAANDVQPVAAAVPK